MNGLLLFDFPQERSRIDERLPRDDEALVTEFFVVDDLGEPPLVTPSSQIVGTQAVLNVLQGERYKMITKETKKILLGEFGQTIKPFNPEVQKKAIGDEKPITCRPADLIPPQLDRFREEYNNLLMDKVKSGNGMTQDRYLTVTVHKKTVEEARAYFNRIAGEIIMHFAQLGSVCVEMTLEERLRVAYDFFDVLDSRAETHSSAEV